MIKNKTIDSFFKRKAYDEDEKTTSTFSQIEILHENPKIEENEKQLSKVPKVIYNEFENILERDRGCVFKFGNIHQIKLMRYEWLI